MTCVLLLAGTRETSQFYKLVDDVSWILYDFSSLIVADILMKSCCSCNCSATGSVIFFFMYKIMSAIVRCGVVVASVCGFEYCSNLLLNIVFHDTAMYRMETCFKPPRMQIDQPQMIHLFYMHFLVFFCLGMHRRQPGNGGVSSCAWRRREPG